MKAPKADQNRNNTQIVTATPMKQWFEEKVRKKDEKLKRNNPKNIHSQDEKIELNKKETD